MDERVTQIFMRERRIAYVLTDRALHITEISTQIPGCCMEDPVAYMHKPLLDLFPELIGYEKLLQGILDGRLPRLHLERVNRDAADGGTIYLDFTDLPWCDATGDIVGLVHLVEDVTHLGEMMQRAIHRGNVALLRAELDKRNEQLARADAKLQADIERVREAQTAAKTSGDLMSICAWCNKRIRDEEGHWAPLEVYITAHFEAKFTHSVCPDCYEDILPQSL